MNHWQNLEGGVFLFRGGDNCNVYAVQGPEGTVLVNAGTGRAAEHLHFAFLDGDTLPGVVAGCRIASLDDFWREGLRTHIAVFFGHGL